jgi:hypothetical protein
MNKSMDETVKRWKAKRKNALVIEIITDCGRRSCAADKLRIVE